MNYLDRFRIQLGSLPMGESEFEFEVDDKFFENFENSPVSHGFYDVLVTVDKKEYMLSIDFTIDGTMTVPCDRCGEDMEVETSGFNELSVKFGENTGEEAEDVIIISPKENELNVAQFIYEYICLSIPMRNVHANDGNGQNTCNPETLARLESLIHHEEGEKITDNRWEILKNINLN